MRFLPVVERELRVTARRPGTYWVRLAAGLLAIGAFGWISLFMRGGFATTADHGRAVFTTLSFFAFVYCLLIGVITTADCISGERREGTLGLLFLTDLKGYDVLLGKLAATSMNAFYGLASIFPIMAIPLLMGGITMEQVQFMAFLLINTLFFSLSCGMLVSSFVSSERSAASGTFLLVGVVTGGLPLLYVVLREWFVGEAGAVGLEPIILPASPAYAYSVFFDSFAAGAIPPELTISLLTTLALSVLMIGVTARRLRHIWKDKPASVARLRWRERWQFWCYGNSDQRRAFRAQLLEENPLCWLAARDRLKPVYVWTCLAVLACLWVWGWFANTPDATSLMRSSWLDAGNYMTTSITISLLLKLWVAYEACHRFNGDRQSGALELLMSTPMTTGEILRGQWQAFSRQFLGPVAVVVFVEIVFVVAGSSTEPDHSWVVAMTCVLVAFVADALTAAWLGMWLGLKSRSATRAFGSVVARVLVLPWFLIIGLSVISLFGRLYGGSMETFATLYLVITLAIDIAFAAWARVMLLNEFRNVAVDRHSFKTGWLWWKAAASEETPGS